MKKRSLILSVLLTIAMVFTMMPAMVFADYTPKQAETKAYFEKADALYDGEYVVTAVGEDGEYALLAPPASRVCQSRKVDFTEGHIVDPGTDAVWSYGENNQNLYKGGNNWLYFSNSDGLKYQSAGYRPLSYKDGKLVTHVPETDSSASSRGNDIFLTFYSDEGVNKFGTKMIVVNSAPQPLEGTEVAEDSIANVNLYRQTFAVDFDLMGHGDVTPERQYSTYDVDKGDSITMPENPKDSVYVFEGWFTEPECINEWTAEAGELAHVTSNLVLYAGWTYHGDALEAAKKGAVDQINATDLSKYKAEQQAAIKSAIAAATKDVDGAKNIEGVDAVVKKFNEFVSAQPTASDINYLAKVSLKNKKVKAGKKKFQIKWKAKASKFDGYEVWYKAKGKGKTWKCVKVANAKAAKKTIKGLKSGKKYKAKVRGYKLYGLNKEIIVLGKFSKSRTVKVK